VRVQARLIRIVTPAPRGSASGNRVTALRWARALRRLGQRVIVQDRYDGGAADLLVALHAVKSHAALERFAHDHPEAPRVVALTGTDLYLELERDPKARRSLELATRIIVLQERALERLSPPEREKTRVIVQSASAPARRERAAPGFSACVLAHLRPVKDPLRAAFAARLLPADSKLAVVHAGAALDPELAKQAEQEARENPRYRWLGSVKRARAQALLSGSDVLVVSSFAEGGANVVTEAIASGIPVLSSRIEGSIGLLGDNHLGYFAPGDTRGLADLLLATERDAQFRAELVHRSEELRPLVDPARELESFRALLSELDPKGGTVTELRLTQLVQGGG
jgi:putative glycosyltransferase (TIGR04348 family)